MSSRVGAGHSGAARGPAHQNSTAFKHNPRSRLTAAIARIPNSGLCIRCHAIIEWRKRYRKYRPLAQPRKCTACHLKLVRFAYHSICTACSQSSRRCPKCLQDKALVNAAPPPMSGEDVMALMADSGVRERRRRLVLRLWEGGEKSDEELRALIATFAAEAADRAEDDEDEGEDDAERSEGEAEEEEDEGEERKERKGQRQGQTAAAGRPLSSSSPSSTSTATPRGVAPHATASTTST